MRPYRPGLIHTLVRLLEGKQNDGLVKQKGEDLKGRYRAGAGVSALTYHIFACMHTSQLLDTDMKEYIYIYFEVYMYIRLPSDLAKYDVCWKVKMVTI